MKASDAGMRLVLQAARFAAHKHRHQRRKDAAAPPKTWSLKRKQEYFDWAKEVVDQVRDASPRLARKFDALYRQRPS